MKVSKATFAAGCFWGVEESFRTLSGVISTKVGYTGGKKNNPSYEEVCSSKTGHLEAVEIEFDPLKISYKKLLETFWSIHNPTQENGQGVDLGDEYLSAIFYHSSEQKEEAEKSKQKLQKSLKEKIVTKILPATIFYPAEKYHQKYLMKQGKSTCRLS